MDSMMMSSASPALRSRSIMASDFAQSYTPCVRSMSLHMWS